MLLIASELVICCVSLGGVGGLGVASLTALEVGLCVGDGFRDRAWDQRVAVGRAKVLSKH